MGNFYAVVLKYVQVHVMHLIKGGHDDAFERQ